MIRAESLTKSFEGLPVLRGVSLSVEEGELFGFVGPNGAGKTTFLKCLLGICRPDGGRAEIAGLDAFTQSLAVRRQVGYAPGEIALYNRLRVRELFEFAVAFHERADRAWGLSQLEALGLPLDRRVGHLSHGMKRKLLVVQALAVETPVVILDEPMEGLDPEVRRRVEEMLLEQARAGRTILFSSHDLASVERVCQRVAFLREGQLLEVGSVAELLDRATHLLTLSMRQPVEAAALPQGEGLRWSGGGTTWRLEYEGELAHALGRLDGLPLAGIRDASGGLAEVFEALYGPGRDRQQD